MSKVSVIVQIVVLVEGVVVAATAVMIEVAFVRAVAAAVSILYKRAVVVVVVAVIAALDIWRGQCVVYVAHIAQVCFTFSSKDRFSQCTDKKTYTHAPCQHTTQDE